MRIIYLGYLLGPLRAVLEQGIEVGLVAVEPGPARTRAMIEFCRSRGLNWVEADEIKTGQRIQDELASGLDLGLVGAFSQILPPDMVDKPRFGWANVHFSYLPFYRGNNPIEWMILNGAEQGGVTYHWINQGIDQGGIIAQARLAIEPGHDYQTVFDNCDQTAYELGLELWARSPADWPCRPQEPDQGFYCPRRTEAEARIGKDFSLQAVDRLVRAEAWKGVVHFSNQGRKLVVESYCPGDERPDLAPGTVVSSAQDRISVVIDGREVFFDLRPGEWRPRPGLSLG
ncbi:MAG: hypothetical protein JRJ59_08410 [Deltaproteobacteria bacterium]|nr:hypothetical protein [Deltaproteobacteria bacterium]